MNSFLRRIKLNRLAPTFVVLSTLSAGILIGSVAVHGVKGSENQVNSSDATPLKIPDPVHLGTQFSKIAEASRPGGGEHLHRAVAQGTSRATPSRNADAAQSGIA